MTDMSESNHLDPGMNIKILLVDDMPTMRRLITKQFQKIGVTNIAEAADGIEAWKLIDEAVPPFQLIISDWAMPNCNGFDLLKRVRGSEKTKRIPFVLVTAEGEKHNVLDAKAAGCTDYVVKPFDPVEISKRFKKYIEDSTAGTI